FLQQTLESLAHDGMIVGQENSNFAHPLSLLPVGKEAISRCRCPVFFAIRLLHWQAVLQLPSA
ncbi:hypothetical protein KAX22_02780, partial [bacterium]|nr:hypothetical protein [bacterium]